MALRMLILSAMLAAPAGAEGFRSFDGHGGPVMGVAVSPDGTRALTASFDYSVGLWEIGRDTPPRWLEGHAAAVNALAFLGTDRAVSAGDDFDILIWDLASARVLHRLGGHKGKVMTARPSPDGSMIASASWDGTVRLWDAETGTSLAVLGDHDGPVNDVAWAAGGAQIYSAGYDGKIVLWDVKHRTAVRRIVRHGFGINVLALDEGAGWLAFGTVDGGTVVVAPDTGAVLADLTAGRRPILALARSPDGSRLAIGDGEGYIMVVDTADWSVAHDFRAAVNGPIWALAFAGDGAGILAGGIDDRAFLWPLDTDDDPAPMAQTRRGFHTAPGEVSNGERQFLRKCSVCHTLAPDGGRRAGPSLHGLFGRRAGTYPGYSYSAALADSSIVWSDATIDKLFEIGPDHVTPGSKMPMQKITAPEDRADLIAFLKRETAPD
ncbi:WD domain/cytochrome c family protein [Rhodovulum sp. P5]|uniref:c-type cytochrome n=1 Tax=Rhodovulum sp. P5 TaxID=1564506 RepID=UPI0009C1B7DD|nr:c-type cytochrome [Rhodovulum sp. P5]ARE41847.1 WD domain/cytochrome c family protein [Rhodovulum sp. P5]